MIDERPDSPATLVLPEDPQGVVCIEPDGRCRTGDPLPPLLVCGSFNPLHQGHWSMAERTSKRMNIPFAFEMSLTNVDKPPLDRVEVQRRARAFLGRAPLWLTRVPTFVAKARLFRGTVFVVGADTAQRIVEPRYYTQSLGEALQSIHDCGCRFIVAGRVDAQGEYRTLADLPIPREWEMLFEELPDFRLDVSSTQLRQGSG
jgi:hypothetical protein